MIIRDGDIAPCVRCGGEGSKESRWDCQPMRFAGEPFGLDGQICRKCYDKLRRTKVPDTAERRPGPPCTRCGTTEGYRYRGRAVPVRYSGEAYGIPSPLCHACRCAVVSARQGPRERPEQASPDEDGIRLATWEILAEKHGEMLRDDVEYRQAQARAMANRARAAERESRQTAGGIPR